MARVRYIRLDVTGLEIAHLQPESEKARLIDILLYLFQKLEAGENIDDVVSDDNPYMGLILGRVIPEMVDGYNQYRQNQRGGRKPPVDDQCLTSGQPVVNQCLTSGRPNQSSSIEEISSDTDINQIRINLRGRGYLDSEIDLIQSRIDDVGQIKNLELYLSRAIDSERKKAKKNPATSYSQRDYHRTESENAKHCDDLLEKLDSLMNENGEVEE